GRRALLGLMGLALLALGWLAAPLVRRHVAFFQVRQIELLGVRNLAPDAVIAALRLPDEASVFSDTRMLADRVRGLAGVADARVVRRLPAALRVELKEVEPAALVAGRGLVVVDAAGRPLPFDPTPAAGGGGPDLPIATTAASGGGGVLALIRSLDAGRVEAVSGARGSARRDVPVGVGLAKNAGVRRGMVRDIEETTRSIAAALRDAERMAGGRVSGVTCGIAGEHVSARTSPGVVAVSREEISAEDVARVNEVARAISLGRDQELLHDIPQEYVVDQQRGISDPVGMTGTRLEVEMYLVTVQATAAQN